jgi:hypothetical protein
MNGGLRPVACPFSRFQPISDYTTGRLTGVGFVHAIVHLQLGILSSIRSFLLLSAPFHILHRQISTLNQISYISLSAPICPSY